MEKTMPKLFPETVRRIERELELYHETRRQIEKLKLEIIHASAPPDEIGGGRSNLPGDPTGRKVAAIATDRRIRYLESIAEAIEEVYDQLPEKKKKLVRMNYWSKSKKYTWDGIAMELDVSRATAFRWRDEIIYAIAERLGWR